MTTLEFPPGAPCWIDLLTSDQQRAQEFYSALFGWTYEVGDQEKYGGYTTALKDGKAVTGLMKNDPGSGYPDIWTTYLRVEDIQATVDAAASHGGTVYLQPMPVPEQGTMAMIGDPAGAAVGLWQFGGHTGYQAFGEHGSPAWHELYSEDYPAALQFYREVLGWDLHVLGDTDEFRYQTLGEGQDARAGIMDNSTAPEGQPSGWQVYFAVDDADQTAAVAQAQGGTVHQSPADTPYGRMAVLADPHGAVFNIMQPLR